MEHLSKEDKIIYQNILSVCASSKTGKEVNDCYQQWAEKYDKDLGLDRYNGPVYTAKAVSELFEGNQKYIKILDVAAGTGLLAEKLQNFGFDSIDALDPSEAMLQQARKKNVYKNYFQEFMSIKRLPIDQDTYDCLTCVGGFGQGHIPIEGLYEMIRIVKPGGFIVIALREEYLQLSEYVGKLEPFMKTLEEQDKWQLQTRRKLNNYCFDKNGILYIYTVL